jgi:4a-hydroxytetrahydrobiopterin dehydratase
VRTRQLHVTNWGIQASLSSEGKEGKSPKEGRVPLLSQAEIDKRIQTMPGWAQVQSSLHKKFTLRTFLAAIELVNGIASAAEKANHHPDFTIRYNVVEITLSTHSAGGITAKDFALAQQIDELASNQR